MSIKEHPPQSDPSKDGRLHVPVLLKDVLETINPQKGEEYLDLTAGYGGHAQAFLDRTESRKTSVLVDRDPFAISQLSSFAKQGVTIMQTDYVSAATHFIEIGKQFDIVFADLGVSSPQLDIAERGFSFSKDGPLDMRMDQSQRISAADVVNTYSESRLAAVIYQFGEEKPSQARKIARAIIAGRPFMATRQLADTIKQTVTRRKGKIHPATRTFQALRIEVNQELRQLKDLLPLTAQLLKPGGRVGVISFHSLEDRLVKQFFKKEERSGYEADFNVLTKHPIRGAINDVHNPRARSAVFRAAVKK